MNGNSWFPLPFPECPSCGTTWQKCTHRNCEQSGEMEIDPWSEHVKCSGCSEGWDVRRSIFYCSCGSQFSSQDVKTAIDEVVRATQSLYNALRQRREDLADIETKSKSSFGAWMEQVAQVVGGAAGFLIGKLLSIIFD